MELPTYIASYTRDLDWEEDMRDEWCPIYPSGLAEATTDEVLAARAEAKGYLRPGTDAMTRCENSDVFSYLDLCDEVLMDRGLTPPADS